MSNSIRTVWVGVCHKCLAGGIAGTVAYMLLATIQVRDVGDVAAATAGAERLGQSVGQVPLAHADARSLSMSFRQAAQKTLPAVVVIKASPSPICPRCGRAHESSDDEAAEGDWMERIGPRSLELLGSGFIVASSGLVLTNKHVIEGNDRLVVQTVDGRQFAVRHVTIDRKHDAAVLHIESDAALPYIELGDSDSVQIGDWVLTMGCPLELEQTVSAGIISAKDRSFCTRHQTGYLQTDAVVNPGSSGGPLVDLNGAAVGIATALASEDGGFQGIGFAIPATLVKKLLAEAMDAHGNETAILPSNPGRQTD